MSVRILALVAVLCATLAGSSCGARDAAEAARPRNLLWISLDTLRADRLGCYGYERATSPALDALAKTAVRFTEASSPAPWTKPAHASLFTGLYPRRHGVLAFENPLAPGVTHVAELLAGSGFQTLAVVSNSVLTLHDMPRGFATFDYLERGQGPEPSGVTSRALERLAALDRTRPFFALVHYNDLHARYRSLPRYEQEFTRPYEGTISSRGQEMLEHLTGIRPMDARDVEHMSDLYDAALRQLDDELARLFGYLDHARFWEDTLVVITSDHGEEFFDHGSIGHGMTQFEELVRVPLLFRGPGLAAGVEVSAPVSLVDVLPTCLALLGLSVPERLDGRDLSAWLCAPQAAGGSGQDHVLHYEASCAVPTPETEVPEPGRRFAIRAGRFKLHWDEATGEARLYDLRRDPEERVDASPAHAALALRLLEELKRFQASERASPSEGELSSEDLRRLQDLGYAQGIDED
jgi:arylsulfatase A-like enzyme